MIVDKSHEIIFQTNQVVGKKNFNLQKRNQATNDFEKNFYKILNNAFCGKRMKKVRNRVKNKIISKKRNYQTTVKTELQ